MTFGPRLHDLIDILTQGLARRGYVNLLRFETNVELEDSILDLRPHAVVSFAPLQAADGEKLLRHGVRVIEQSGDLQERLNLKIGQRQAQHLASCGYKAMVAALPVDVRERPFAQPRAAGANEWALHHGIAVLPALHLDIGQGHPVQAIADLPNLPIGIAAYNDNVALAVLGAAHQAGRRVPHELGIIGTDNSQVARLTVPTLSTLDFDLEYSAEQLLQAIDGEDWESTAATEVEARLRLVDGGSTSLSPDWGVDSHEGDSCKGPQG